MHDGSPKWINLRTTLLDYKRRLRHVKGPEDLPFNLHTLEQELCQFEAASRLTTPTRSRTTTVSRTRRYSQANYSTPVTNKKAYTSKYKTPSGKTYKHTHIRCFFCGGNHSLKDCKTCPPAEKPKLWDKHKISKPRRFNNSTKTYRANQACSSTHKDVVNHTSSSRQ